MYVDKSSLATSLFGAGSMGAIGQVGKIDSAKSTDGTPSAADAAAKRDEAAKLAQREALAQIREKGLYAWAQEQKLEKLKEKIRAQVMEANPGADPATIENEVARQVKEAMEQTLKAEADEAAKRGEPARPMIIDISI